MLTPDDFLSDEDEVDQERACLRCGLRPIWGRPWTVYVCYECHQLECFNCGNDLLCGLHPGAHLDGTSDASAR